MLYLVPQKRHNECNIGVLVTVLNAYKDDIYYDDIRKLINDKSLYNMHEVLEKYSIKCEAIEFYVNNIYKLEFKVMIVHCKNLLSSHFIVLEKEEDIIYFYDPSLYGRKVLNKKTINTFTGYGIIINNSLEIAYRKNENIIHFPTKVILITLLINIILVLLIYYL